MKLKNGYCVQVKSKLASYLTMLEVSELEGMRVLDIKTLRWCKSKKGSLTAILSTERMWQMFCPGGKKSMGGSIVEQKISRVVSVSGDSQPPSVSQKRPSLVSQTLKRNISPQSSFSIISLSWRIHKRTHHPQWHGRHWWWCQTAEMCLMNFLHLSV